MVVERVELITLLPFYFISYGINSTTCVLEPPRSCENQICSPDQGQNLWDKVYTFSIDGSDTSHHTT